MKLKFSMPTFGPSLAVGGGLGGGSVANAAGGTGVGSTAVATFAAAGLEHAATKTADSTPIAMASHRALLCVTAMTVADTPACDPRMGSALGKSRCLPMLELRVRDSCWVHSSEALSEWQSSAW
jgi:hypothetical protein